MFGISGREIKRTLAVLLALALILTSSPLSSFATDVGNMLNSMMRNGGEVTVSDGDVSDGDSEGGQGTVSGEEVKINISGAGTGEVALNGESKTSGSVTEVSAGDAVTLKITPASNGAEGWRSYIKSAEVAGGESLIEGTPDLTAVYSTTKTITTDEVWNVVFGKQYKYAFGVNDTAGGTVTLTNGRDVNYTYSETDNAIWVDSESANLTLNITPNDNYKIEYVKVGNDVLLQDGKEATFGPVQVDVEATDINVKFIKVYEVTVTYENGTVLVDNNALTSGVTYIGEWDENGTAPFIATPATGYHISSVVINDEEQLDSDVANYETQLNKNRKYAITVTFEINEYMVTLNGAGADVADIFVGDAADATTARTFTVNHGDNFTWIIDPKTGLVSAVKVGETDVVKGQEGLVYTLSNITSDVIVDISIVPIPTENDEADLMDNIQAGATLIDSKYYDITLSNPVLRVGTMADGTPFVVVKAGTLITAVPNTVVKDGVEYAYDNIGFGDDTETLTATVTLTPVDSMVVVNKILVSKEAKGYLVDDVCQVLCNYVIVVDGTEPFVTLPASGYNQYFAEDFSVSVNVDETVNGSGIAKVEYWTVAEGASGTGSAQTPLTVYQYSAGEVAKLSDTFVCDIEVENNNSANVTLYVKVTDIAGNVTTEDMPLYICTTEPVVSVAIDGTIAEGGENGYYQGTRTATITITDRADVFDEDAALAGVVFDNCEASVEYIGSNGDVHTLTVTFTEDDVYEWTLSYKNKAGLEVEKTDVQTNGENVWSFVMDNEAVDVTLSIDGDNATGFEPLFNTDVIVKVSADDTDDIGNGISGIKSVSYRVLCGTVVAVDTTELFNGTQGATEWTGVITLAKDDYDYNGIIVEVTVVDMAGMTTVEEYELSIDTTKPVITVDFNGNNGEYDETGFDSATGTYYYQLEERTATITVKEKNFNREKFVLVINSTDNSIGTTVLRWNELTWTNGSGENEYVTTYPFAGNKAYTWTIEYADEAGNEYVLDEATQNNAELFNFALDTIEPEAKVSALPRGTVWNDVLNMFTFNELFNTQVNVVSVSTDNVSPIKMVEYYRVNGDEIGAPLSVAELKAIYEEDSTKEEAERRFQKSATGISVNPNQKFVVYVRVTDYAGNVDYTSTDGIIADSTAPSITSISPSISIADDGKGLANGDVQVGVNVSDSGYAASGLASVKYKVYSMGQATQEGDLPVSGQGSVTVSGTMNNSNDVKVEVTAIDKAGNPITSSSSSFRIDTTAPVITVSYDNNTPDSGNLYNANRVATITVTERNFDPSRIVINITNTEGVIPAISAWTEVLGTGNMDNTTHTATIVYQADGDYTFDISCTDLAGNKSTTVNYAEGTVNPTEFTIDQTNPVINVTYDNNDAENDTYFAENRTATITIVEHNFVVDRVVLTQTAKLDGTNIAVPEIKWTHNGDVHTGTIVYDEDGDYTFDVSMTDMAGNQNSDVDFGNSVAAKAFTVDTTINVPAVTGVEDGMSYKDVVIPVISYEDVNFAVSEIKLLRTRNGEINTDVTEQFITGMEEIKYGGEGTNDTFGKIAENDGIYTLIVKVTDKAGNEETETVVFTVNRYGSVYAFNDYLVSLQDSYVQKVDGSIVITEYNPDELIEDSVKVEITKDGTPLSNVVFTLKQIVDASTSNGENGWYQYEYAIDASNFVGDGIYKISVSSEDKAGNKPETANFEDCTVLFRVDTVNAEITSIRGLETDIVNAESQTVEFDVFDAIGLKKVTVYVNDDVVNAIEEFENIINFTGSVVLTEGTNQKIRIVVEDIAGNVTDTASETFAPMFVFNNTITVSTSFWIRFMANKPLFFGTIGGAVALVGGSVAAVTLRGRKRKTIKK